MTDEERAALWMLIDQWDETGADDARAAIIAALAAWPRTKAGRLQQAEGGFSLVRQLQRCAVGVIHAPPLELTEEEYKKIHEDYKNRKDGYPEDDDIPF